MTRNGSEAEADEFRALPRDERELRIYLAARGGEALVGELHFDLGNLTRELARNSVALSRNATASEMIAQAFATTVKVGASSAASRAPLPSLMDIREEDVTAIRDFKASAAPALRDWADARVVRAWWIARLKFAILVFGVVTGGAAMVRLIWLTH